ncbi:hypothetical protein EIKCOROL_00875 [Eikenella corrodens ATCC 23834]|uniref:Uncharacterized protein n=1 Tax=Eikenella corrodens ATCC 23834 TaxID=546274 RepID=C0DU44_EIKCO|nr:hypothetical protein EIKCOROL_00875 [Eikenella corrodens ATCC 23834]
MKYRIVKEQFALKQTIFLNLKRLWRFKNRYAMMEMQHSFSQIYLKGARYAPRQTSV